MLPVGEASMGAKVFRSYQSADAAVVKDCRTIVAPHVRGADQRSIGLSETIAAALEAYAVNLSLSVEVQRIGVSRESLCMSLIYRSRSPADRSADCLRRRSLKPDRKCRVQNS